MVANPISKRETPDHAVRRVRSLASDAQGAVFVEFLIAFLPVYVFFLCFIQLGLLFAVRLLTEHAATTAARAAAVVLGDEKGRYGGEAMHQLSDNPRRSKRFLAVQNAALLAMSPMILNGMVQSVDIFFPPAEEPGGPEQGRVKLKPMSEDAVSKVRVRVEVQALCQIGLASQIACPRQGWIQFRPTASVVAEAIYPYQGASYEY